MINNYEEPGDDSIVPSTPTLYVPRCADGFSEAVSSPQSHVSINRIIEISFTQCHLANLTFVEISLETQHQGGHQQTTARFTFAESATRTPEGIDDTRIDLTQLDDSGGRNVSTIASQSPRDTSSTSATVPSVEAIEPIAGTSAVADANVPQVLVHEVEGKLIHSIL